MKKEQDKIPKDLGIKIGTELEVLWTNVKNNVEKEIKASENEILINKELLKIAKLKILAEERRRKV